MLTILRKKAPPVKEPDAVDLLRECHDRIRKFTRLAAWLAHAHDAPAVAVQETAESVLRYFTEALPRHSADEEESIAPRLAGFRMPVELSAAIATMTRQHEVLHAAIDKLVPMWRAVAESPEKLSDHALQMERLVDQLRGLWDVHLHLEETVIFPALRSRLSPTALTEIRDEIRARRR